MNKPINSNTKLNEKLTFFLLDKASISTQQTPQKKKKKNKSDAHLILLNK